MGTASARPRQLILCVSAKPRRTPTGYVRSVYRADEIDLLAAYSRDLDQCYLLPAELVDGRAIQLRLGAARKRPTGVR